MENLGKEKGYFLKIPGLSKYLGTDSKMESLV